MQTASTQNERLTSAGATGLSSTVLAIQEFLTFKLGDEEYGMDIQRVQEIRSYEVPTRMTHAPHYIKGVVNLRGVIVPILDLRMKFGLLEVTYTDFTVVIVINVGQRIIGMVVDSVSDVIKLLPEQLRCAPGFSGSVDADHVMAIGSLEDRMLILLDIEKVMVSADMG